MFLYLKGLFDGSFLSPNFPQEAPGLSLRQPLRHPWIDGQGHILGHNQMKHWTNQMDLGKLIQELVQEFQSDRAQFSMNPSNSKATTRIRDNRIDSSGLATSFINDPRLESIYGDLKNLSIVELSELLDRDSQLTGYVKKIDISSSLRKIILELETENQRLAKENIDFAPKIETSKLFLSQKEKKLKDLLQEYQNLLSTHHEIFLRHCSIDSLITKLKEKAKKSDEEAEIISQKFLDKFISADEFVRDYRQSRKDFHLRTCLAEKFSTYHHS